MAFGLASMNAALLISIVLAITPGGAFDDGRAELRLLPGYHEQASVTVGADRLPTMAEEDAAWEEYWRRERQRTKPSRNSDDWAPPAGMTDARMGAAECAGMVS